MRNWCTRLRSWLRGDALSLRRASASRRPLNIESLEDRLSPATNAVAGPTPYKGDGYSVAVLDTGINYNLPDFGGGWGKRVIAGYNFVDNTPDPMDDNGHGTHVAGIIASSSSLYPGIAPDVNLIALKVLDQNAVGSWTAIDNALQWVAAHQAQYNIVAVNMSFGYGNYSTVPTTFLENDFATLKNEGVFLTAAAGNNYFTYQDTGLAYPAISPQVVSVGAVWAGNFAPFTWDDGATDSNPTTDQILSVSQRSTALDLLAPGAWIMSDWNDGTYKLFGGTSMAAAEVTGAAVLLHQAYDTLGEHSLTGEDSLLHLLQTTGTTITDVNHGTDNVPHTGLSFPLLNLPAALSAIGLPKPPALTSIADQSISHTHTPLVLNLAATDPDGLPVTFTAQLATTGAPVQLAVAGSQLTITPASGYLGTCAVQVTASNGYTSSSATFNVTVTNTPPTLTAPANQALHHGQPDTLTLAGSDADGDPLQYSAAIVSAPAVPPALLTVQGNVLTIAPASTFTGTFTVQVGVSDGLTSVTQTFTVTVTNSPPALTSIADQTATGSLTLPLTATDADGDTLTFSAQVLAPPPSSLYQLNQQLQLQPYNGSYYTNLCGANEKWLVSASGVWYALLPNGHVYRWAGTFTTTVQPANLVATLSTAVYADPTLLWQAQAPVAPAVTLSIKGNLLTLTPPPGYTGTFTVAVAVTDGLATDRRTFTVTVAPPAPTLAAIAAQTVAGATTTLTVPLPVTNPSGSALSYSATVLTPDASLYKLNQQLQLHPYNGSYYANLCGASEKWLVAADGTWYALMPNGSFYRWAGGFTATIQPANLVASLPTSVYADPRLLWQAAPPQAPALTVSVQGGSLVIQRPPSLVGVFFVTVTVNNGHGSTQQTFEVVLG
jgi:hypothetical protein